MKRKIFLVACVAAKRGRSHPAKDLYISRWFMSARAVAEASGAPWFILSARYGLLHPDVVVAPYEQSLLNTPAERRRAWAEKVISQMKERMPPADDIVVFAGERYREFLMSHLKATYRTVTVPMEGLAIGKQLRFLSQEAKRAARFQSAA